MLTRRNFLTAVGLAGGSLSLPLKAEALLPAALSAEGERFSGFALLPPGAPPPFDLAPAHREPPVLCGTGLGRGGPELTGRTVELSSPEEAAGYSGLTLYTLSPHADRVLTGARVVEYDDAEIESVTLSWESTDARTGQRSTNLRLSATSLFPRPLPLWETLPVEPGGPSIRLNKVGFLPQSGVMVGSVDGYIFHWIDGGVYYQLYVENNSPFPVARQLARSLETVAP